MCAIVLARGGSKGIPNKNLIPFHGYPLMTWTLWQLQSAGVARIAVSTDSSEIATEAGRHGATVVWRPPELASDTASSDSALLHALDYLKIADADFVLMPQITSPLRHSEHIELIVEQMADGDVDSIFSAVQFDDLCLWRNTDGLQSISYDYRTRARRQDRSALFVENGSLYCSHASSIRASHNRLSGKVGLSLMPSWAMWEIDRPEDVIHCEILFREYCSAQLKSSMSRRTGETCEF